MGMHDTLGSPSFKAAVIDFTSLVLPLQIAHTSNMCSATAVQDRWTILRVVMLMIMMALSAGPTPPPTNRLAPYLPAASSQAQ